MQPGEKKKLLSRLARAEGQVSAIRRMVEADKYCVDVLVQVAAARGALARVGGVVLENHLQTCVASALDDPTARDEKMAELMDLFTRFAGLGKGA
ncbi:MAG: metal-sensitive transcriptional regulator [Myxococcales bacterium]|nr:metal-sensitive transcriptional regulator [Myxococcales bacterium]